MSPQAKCRDCSVNRSRFPVETRERVLYEPRGENTGLKNGGNMGKPGSVIFTRVAVLVETYLHMLNGTSGRSRRYNEARAEIDGGRHKKCPLNESPKRYIE